MKPTTYFHGARVQLAPGSQVNRSGDYAYFSPDLDAAIWAAELSEGDQEPRVYCVATSGPIENATDDGNTVKPPHPAMSLRARGPLEVVNAKYGANLPIVHCAALRADPEVVRRPYGDLSG